jgi:CheY-like chemotaxis protein
VKDLIPRVFIVDDEAEFRLLVKDALPGFDVVEAENGRQALDVVQEVKLDLVITDIKMPVLDGKIAGDATGAVSGSEGAGRIRLSRRRRRVQAPLRRVRRKAPGPRTFPATGGADA